MRDYDEKNFFEKFSKEMDIEYDSTPEYLTLDNVNMAKGYDAISFALTKIDKKILDELHKLGIKYISTRSIGYEHIDVSYAKELGIKVSNVGYPSEAVADYTIMLMLMCCRNYKLISTTAQAQDFSLKGKMGKEISNLTIGVIGTGRIGRTVIEHLRGFNTKILAYDIYENEEVKKYAEYVDFDTLIKESDIITLHCPATKENYHLIDKEAFNKMKDGVIIVNTARGVLINENHMIDAIEEGKIYAFGTDVCEDETGICHVNVTGKVLKNHTREILNSYPNVVVTPHMAFYTEASVADIVKNSLKALKAFYEGEETVFEIN